MTTPQQPEQPEDELRTILKSLCWGEGKVLEINVDRAMRLLHRSNLEAQKTELVTATPHFTDNPTNFVYYNERLADLDKQLKENTDGQN